MEPPLGSGLRPCQTLHDASWPRLAQLHLLTARFLARPTSFFSISFPRVTVDLYGSQEPLSIELDFSHSSPIIL